MCVDPGVLGTGICTVEQYQFGWRIIRKQCVYPARKYEFLTRMGVIHTEFLRAFAHDQPDFTVVEGAELWEGSELSLTAGLRGDLMKLSYTIGSIICVVQQRTCPIVVVPPQGWKGQLSKENVKERLFKVWHENFDDHVADAVGIATHFIKGGL